MPDVTIKPATSIDDNGTLRMTEYRNVVGKIVPVYLVALQSGKTEKYFIATKFDDTPNCGKFVGIYHGGSEETIVSTYDEILRNTDKANYVEIQFPWHRILSVRSLLYKHK